MPKLRRKNPSRDILPEMEPSFVEEPFERGVFERMRDAVARPKRVEDFVKQYELLKKRTRIGINQPTLRVHASPDRVMQGFSYAEGTLMKGFTLFPGTDYPIAWTPPEFWGMQYKFALDPDTAELKLPIPLGISTAMFGQVRKSRVYAVVPIDVMDISFGWGRLGVIGRKDFSVDIVHPDSETKVAILQKRLRAEQILRGASEELWSDLRKKSKVMSEVQENLMYPSVLKLMTGRSNMTPETEDIAKRVVERATKTGEQLRRTEERT